MKDYRAKVVMVRELLRDNKIVQAFEMLGELLDFMEKDRDGN